MLVLHVCVFILGVMCVVCVCMVYFFEGIRYISLASRCASPCNVISVFFCMDVVMFRRCSSIALVCMVCRCYSLLVSSVFAIHSYPFVVPVCIIGGVSLLMVYCKST